MAGKLTQAQLDRQDFVDGVIHGALEELAGRKLTHDIFLIGEVRDAIEAVFAERFIMIEIEFYPFIVEHP